jgi:hypothetical protein
VNDDCASAILVSTLPYTTGFNTELATIDLDVNTSSCNMIDGDHSVWWHLTRDSTTCISAEVNNANLAIFKGLSCGSLACVGQSGYMPVYWIAEANEHYYIMVTGGSDVTLRLMVGADFERIHGTDLFITNTSGKESSSCISNVQCSTAASIVSLLYLSSLPVPYSALEASNDTSMALLCSQLDPQGMKWYRFTGSGNCVQLSPKVPDKYPPNIIAVLEGDTCGSLTCLIEPFGQYELYDVYFTTEQNKSYWIVVEDFFLLSVRNDSSYEMCNLCVYIYYYKCISHLIL